jgi:hypothetical protein
MKMKMKPTRTCRTQQRPCSDESLQLLVPTLNKPQTSQINNVMMHLKLLENQQQNKQIQQTEINYKDQG